MTARDSLVAFRPTFIALNYTFFLVGNTTDFKTAFIAKQDC